VLKSATGRGEEKQREKEKGRGREGGRERERERERESHEGMRVNLRGTYKALYLGATLLIPILYGERVFL